MPTNDIKVAVIAHDQSFSSALRKAAREAETFSGKIKLVSGMLGNVLHGNLQKAGFQLKALGQSMGGWTHIARMGVLAVGAGVGVMAAAIKSCVGDYATFATAVERVHMLTGLSIQSSSKLAGQFKLTGVDIAAGTKMVVWFDKNLYKAQTGVKASVKVFQQLGVAFKDNHGKMLDGATVLARVRDALSKMTDTTKRTALMMAVFGRGAYQGLRWLLTSPAQIAKFNDFLKKTGMIMGPSALTAFQKYRAAQEKIGVAFMSLKMVIGKAFMPILTRLMNYATSHMQSWAKTVAAHMPGIIKWFENAGGAIKKLIPILGGVLKAIYSIMQNRAALCAALALMGAAALAAAGPWGRLLIAIVAVVTALKWLLNNAQTAAAKTVAAAATIKGGNVVIPGTVPHAGGISGALPGGATITAHTGHAAGGVFTSPAWAYIAESGPEAIIPLTRPVRAAQLAHQAGLDTGGGGRVTYNDFHFYGDNVGSDAYSLAGNIQMQSRRGQKRLAYGRA